MYLTYSSCFLPANATERTVCQYNFYTPVNLGQEETVLRSENWECDDAESISNGNFTGWYFMRRLLSIRLFSYKANHLSRLSEFSCCSHDGEDKPVQCYATAKSYYHEYIFTVEFLLSQNSQQIHSTPRFTSHEYYAASIMFTYESN